MAAVSWSGGKDCCLALMRAWPQYDVRAMITMFDDTGERSRSHGLQPSVIEAQAERLSLATITRRCTWPTYETAFADALTEVTSTGCTHVIFGDIFEDAHRGWTERLCADAGLVAVQPIWAEPTHVLVREFIERGGRARMVTVRESYLDASWLGRTVTEETVREYEALGVDSCGERGEFHTLVTDCPLFSSPLQVTPGRRVFVGGCWAEDIAITTEEAHAAV